MSEAELLTEVAAAAPKVRKSRAPAAGAKPRGGRKGGAAAVAADGAVTVVAAVVVDGTAAGAAAAAELAAPSTKAKAPAKRPRASAKAKPAAVAGAEAGDPAAVAAEAAPVAAAAAGAAAKAAPPKRAKKEPAVVGTTVYYSAALRKPPPPAAGEGSVLNILSWNVAGLRALLKKDPDALSRLAGSERCDVVCLQEHKLQEGHVAGVSAALGLQGWDTHWTCSTTRLGYSGVAIACRAPPLAVTHGLLPPPGGADPDPEHEGEGRVLTVELPELFVVNVYVPNSGDGLKRLSYRVDSWDAALAGHVAALQARGGGAKPVVLAGDLNCAHREIDIHNPKGNLRSAGFTEEERESFGQKLLGPPPAGVGLLDSFRTLHPGVVAYTYFNYMFKCRANNKGWRLDYFLVSPGLMPEGEAASGQEDVAEADAGAAGAAAPWRVYDSWILPDVLGSDHVPVGLTLVRRGG